MPSSRNKKPLPEYQHPPVNEVACGIVFEPLDRLKAPHTGVFWRCLGEDRFPICEHAELVGVPPVMLGPVPMARIWYISEKSDELVQLQNDRLLFNWRRQADDDPYPRYKKIIVSFRKTVGIFLDFIKNHELGDINLKGCELTYFNHIYEGDGWREISEIGQVFPDLSWGLEDRFLPPPTSMRWNASFNLPEGKGILHANVRHGKRRSDQKPVLSLELSAQGLGDRKELKAAWEWFELAHEWIVRGFADLSSREVQRSVWGRIENG